MIDGDIEIRVVGFDGFDLATEPELREAIGDLVRAGHRRIVIEAESVDDDRITVRVRPARAREPAEVRA